MSNEKNRELDTAAKLRRGEGETSVEEELEVPTDALGTARRLWQAAAGQRWRLVVATICSILYVAGSLGATAYSAHLIDLLWTNIQEAFARRENFVAAIGNGGEEILVFLGIWTAAWVFYTI